MVPPAKVGDLLRKIYEKDQVFTIMKLQAAMRSYLASKKANASKYGSYHFKDFNEECEGDYHSEIVDRVIKSQGMYKPNKAYDQKAYGGKKRDYRGMELQENGAKYQGEYDEEKD